MTDEAGEQIASMAAVQASNIDSTGHVDHRLRHRRTVGIVQSCQSRLVHRFDHWFFNGLLTFLPSHRRSPEVVSFGHKRISPSRDVGADATTDLVQDPRPRLARLGPHPIDVTDEALGRYM